MGCATSHPSRSFNKDVDKKIKKAHLLDRAIVKLLLLGTGECGKSTFVKQIYNLHGQGYNDLEKKNFLHLVRSNVIQCMLVLIGGIKQNTIPLDLPETEELMTKIEGITFDQIDSRLGEILEYILEFTKDDAYNKVLLIRNKLQLMDSFDYYMLHLKSYFQDNYEITKADIVAARSKTTGIQETDINVNNVTIRLIDVGGQRSERRKWIHCFDSVNGVMFITSLSEYDLLLAEDGESNRMIESLHLFGNIANNNYFINKPIILFFNKLDIFQKKIQTSIFSEYFPDYKGENTEKEVLEFIVSTFMAENKNQSKTIYSHITTAVNPENVKLVFDAVLDLTIAKNMQDVGLV